MQIYKIAEMNIAISPRYPYTSQYLADYRTDETEYELKIAVSDEMIRFEQQLNREIHGTEARKETGEVVAILRVLCDHIIKRSGFFLHCSCLKYDGGAYLFTAPSGTGKSTHAMLWRRHFGDKVEMINDDKPLVREKDKVFTIYGTPWRGKHGIGNNISAPIKAIFFLEQAKKNSIEPLEAVDALTLLLPQTVLPTDKEDMSILLDMLSRMIESVPMFRLKCNISDEAVITALSQIKQ